MKKLAKLNERFDRIEEHVNSKDVKLMGKIELEGISSSLLDLHDDALRLKENARFDQRIEIEELTELFKNCEELWQKICIPLSFVNAELEVKKNKIAELSAEIARQKVIIDTMYNKKRIFEEMYEDDEAFIDIVDDSEAAKLVENQLNSEKAKISELETILDEHINLCKELNLNIIDLRDGMSEEKLMEQAAREKQVGDGVIQIDSKEEWDSYFKNGNPGIKMAWDSYFKDGNPEAKEVIADYINENNPEYADDWAQWDTMFKNGNPEVQEEQLGDGVIELDTKEEWDAYFKNGNPAIQQAWDAYFKDGNPEAKEEIAEYISQNNPEYVDDWAQWDTMFKNGNPEVEEAVEETVPTIESVPEPTPSEEEIPTTEEPLPTAISEPIPEPTPTPAIEEPVVEEKLATEEPLNIGDAVTSFDWDKYFDTPALADTKAEENQMKM